MIHLSTKQNHEITHTTVDMLIGAPEWTQEELVRLFSFGEDGPVVKTNERFIPRILVDLGVAKSTSEVKRNRPDLFQEIPEGLETFMLIKFGKHRLAMLVGK